MLNIMPTPELLRRKPNVNLRTILGENARIGRMENCKRIIGFMYEETKGANKKDGEIK